MVKRKEIAREKELMETTNFLDEKNKKFKSTYIYLHVHQDETF